MPTWGNSWSSLSFLLCYLSSSKLLLLFCLLLWWCAPPRTQTRWSSQLQINVHCHIKRKGVSVAQSRITYSQKPELSMIQSVVTKWVGGRYVLGFAPALRFLRSPILCRLYKNHSDETTSRGHLHVHAWKRTTHACLRSCSPCQSLVD